MGQLLSRYQKQQYTGVRNITGDNHISKVQKVSLSKEEQEKEAKKA